MSRCFSYLLLFYIFFSCGAAVIIAGSTTSQTGSTDGYGTTARFNGARGVAINSAGDVIVADQSNNRIRKITTSGAE